MEQAVYWLWFAGLFGRGTRLSHEMLEFYGSAEAVFEASEQELRQKGNLYRVCGAAAGILVVLVLI